LGWGEGMHPRAGLLGPEALRDRELARLVLLLVRFRATGLSLGLVLATATLLLGRAEDRAVLWVAIAVIIPVVAFDVGRLLFARGHIARSLWIDLGFAVLGQTVLITFTGGIESPLVVVYIPLALMSGAALGPRRPIVGLIGLVVTALWAMFFASLAGWIPRAIPTWLGLEHGFVDAGYYGATKTFFLSVVVLVAARLGVVVHRTLNRLLSSAIEARDEALEALLAQNRELVQLSRAIAHELKNPLASVNGLVQLLERGGANSERRFEVLKQEIARMRSILDELLQFSRPLGELSVEDVDVPRLMEELTLIHEGLATSRELTIELPRVDVPTVRADPKKLKQALMNLLQNAIDASQPGQVVRWYVGQDPSGALQVGVEDSGGGFSEQLLAEVREKGPITSSKSHGHGIGLRVTRGIAEQHGGALRLENRAEGGARAVLVLPRAA
ncbi:HAMP domain-containing histidine kinase, partial [Myxococcota bacterium]|nr:HAMP domain-containing histidine kinase [Myxococcota bacterium]